MILQAIADAIASSPTHLTTSENNRELNIRYRTNRLSPNKLTLADALKLITDRDSFYLQVKYEDSDQTSSLSDKTDRSIENFCTSIETQLILDPAAEAVIHLKILKDHAGKFCTIYSLRHIADYWAAGQIRDVITRIKSLASDAYILECKELTRRYKTGIFIFTPPLEAGTQLTNPEPSIKKQHLTKREKACVFYDHDSFDFIPQDFHFDAPIPNEEIALTFKRLQLAFSLIALCDNSRIDESGSLKLKLVGYKTITSNISTLADIECENAESFYEIYNWAYTDGNVVDKIGICRNIISIHSDGDNIQKIKDGCIDALKSNYSIYLKENLKQYLDIKNKISEQIQKSSEKASDLAKNIGNYLRASIFSVYSFVFSVFLIRALSKNNNGPMLSNATYLIFLLFVAISAIVLAYAVLETNSEIKRFKSNYKSTKKRYSDLVSAADLSRIIDNDSQYKSDIEHLRSARMRAVILWILSLLIILLVITTLKIKEF